MKQIAGRPIYYRCPCRHVTCNVSRWGSIFTVKYKSVNSLYRTLAGITKYWFMRSSVDTADLQILLFVRDSIRPFDIYIVGYI